jgi:hypothetical protein
MKATLVRVLVPAFLITLVTACSTQPSSLNGGGTFTADLDGTHFQATANYISTAGTGGVIPGSAIITGTQVNGTTNTISVSLSIGYITGTGTYPLGVNQLTTAGGTLIVSTTSGSSVGTWSSGVTGAAGTVTITSITSSQIVGTFQATAYPQSGTASTNKVVTNGKFTVPLGGFTVAPSSNPGSLIKATLGGTAFNAATVTGQSAGASFATLGTTTDASNHTTSISLTVSGSVVSGGSYPLVPPSGGGTYVAMMVTINNTSYGGLGSGDSGSVTITSFSGGRAKGTFSGTLSGGLSVTGGTFDVKLGGF